MEKKVICSLKSTMLKRLLLATLILMSVFSLRSRILADSAIYRVTAENGYLALRSSNVYDNNNEIGRLYLDDSVEVLNASDPVYWYVYATRLGQYGYVNKKYLEASTSSSVSEPSSSTGSWIVKVDSGYLALRTAKAFDRSNEIGKLYTGDTVEVQDSSDSTYWYVYSAKLGKYGYVNKEYLIDPDDDWTVKVDSGYLALRSAKAFDRSNEIGKLYTGDTVQIQDSSDSTYWYVYAPTLKQSGYVNKDYLIAPAAAPASGSTWSVKVDSGYLALRTAKAYDRSNEIGELYTGDTVQVQDASDSTYWYVYAPTLGKYGYVDKNYLVAAASAPASGTSGVTRTVRVDSGYLALRSAKAFDRSNEIGKLYSGDTVEVQDSSGSDYWYVYAPTLGKYGYVNCDYLY